MTTSRTFSYKPLWKLLIDKDLNKTQLQDLAGLSPATMAKLGKGANVTTDVLLRICQVLNCQVGDIVEVVATNESKEYNE
ncbi:transcriptional regulator [Corynebacterium diphtheriae]|uniref:helix-turn-helix domain-containing protein n=1 Tax=Corynebacterium diphtheriae TaxID=1717 RepID=UPI0013C8DFBA|nr:helix-turn-helix domain-containing protein [Corynebacterium diphtheriae]MBG9253009.1 helix-turn-helix domain-containing protein [Corynebacterium diphtheriae bv. mitis]CAB0841313.1 transcriptional regulator [Corynebacterium diphtheriae]CAB0875519.1 transcriptional regulator [Corynebacterium diphtheriae]